MSTNPFDPSQAEPVPATSAMIVSKVTPPAIALMVIGVLNCLMAVYQGINNLVMMTKGPELLQQNPQFEQMQRDMEAQGVEFDPAQFMQTMQMIGPIGIVIAILALVIGVVIILGALKMKQLRSYGMAFTSAVLAMIPCLSPCCIFGLPIGIWAIVVLNNAEVKSAFR